MKIAVVTKAPFPDGNASATYVLNVCRVMKLCGHDLTVLGCRRGLKTDHAAVGEFDGIKYLNYDATKHSKIVTYLYDNKFERYATKTLSKLGRFDIIFLYGGTVTVAEALKNYCDKKGMRFGAFNCEWYTEDCFSSGVSRRYIRETVDLIPYVAKNADVAILISTLLTNYFEDQGTHSVMIPNIVDLTDNKWDTRQSNVGTEKMKIAYAGSPSVGKDELATVIKSIELLPDDIKNRTELNIYGPNKDELMACLKTEGLSEIPSQVICHGRKKQDDIPALLNDCHYTILIRKPSLRANAGFSTKMVESFAAGVPFIANITGDIATYLKDGENGIVVANDSLEACCDAMISAYEKLDKNPEMRKAAFKTAQDNFDYRKYKDAMEEFLNAPVIKEK